MQRVHQSFDLASGSSETFTTLKWRQWPIAAVPEDDVQFASVSTGKQHRQGLRSLFNTSFDNMETSLYLVTGEIPPHFCKSGRVFLRIVETRSNLREGM
jgi:hypothetical protein